jgi:alanine racemase
MSAARGPVLGRPTRASNAEAGSEVRPLVSATVDTAALRHNLDVVRRLAPQSRVMAVVKANAYGHGLVAVARALRGADALAVARVEEGVSLRQAGIDAPIVLLEGVFDQDQLAAAGRHGFELVVHIPEQIEFLRRAPCGSDFKVWLKLDSGMNRLGFKGAEFDAAAAALGGLSCVRQPIGLFTHLASADEAVPVTTPDQLARFAAATVRLTGARCVANSAGLLRFPVAHADWVRPGLLLYGVSPVPGATGAAYGLKPAMTLRSRIIAVKEVGVGEKVGYGGDWTAARPTRLAIAAVGYGDGYPRSLASGAPVLVNGRRAALAGRVSMDMIGIDITDIEACRGDPVILWGEGLPVEEIAVLAGAVPYELLCGISQRVAVELI